MMEKVLKFLEKLNLEEYGSKLEEVGYDDLDQILNIDQEELKELLNAIGMTKLGHINRLKKAIADHCKSRIAVPDDGSVSEVESENVVESVNISPAKMNYPKCIRHLYIPNPLTKRYLYYNLVLKSLFEDIYEDVDPNFFISYVSSQREERWSFESESLQLKSSADSLFDPAHSMNINIVRLCSEDYGVRKGKGHDFKILCSVKRGGVILLKCYIL